MKFLGKNNWFTFIEMLWVLAIVVILIGVSTVSFRHWQAKARDVVRKSDLQTIADALMSYSNDHGHFPSSIYDNWNTLTISQALNSVTEWWTYVYIGWNIIYIPDADYIPYLSDEYFTSSLENYGGINDPNGGLTKILNLNKLEEDKNKPEIKDIYENIISTIDTFEKNAPVVNLPEDYSIVTQGMCASSLQKYLVNEWYLSEIPQDPSWESVNLQTNICADPWNFQWWVNANDAWWSIQSDCFAFTNTWCTQICKEWYVYVSDWEHFALIAHMESDNGWNYEITSCDLSCELANCEYTEHENKISWESTSQLPCDITDEFTRSFSCIQDHWIVEYNTWEYYFYVY